MHIIRVQSDLTQNQFIKNKLKYMLIQDATKNATKQLIYSLSNISLNLKML